MTIEGAQTPANPPTNPPLPRLVIVRSVPSHNVRHNDPREWRCCTESCASAQFELRETHPVSSVGLGACALNGDRCALQRSPALNGEACRCRTVSYEELQTLGLGKAVDEYHRLLASAPTGRTSRKPSAMGTLLRATVARPLPRVLRPEAIASLLGHLGVALAYLLHYTAIVIVPGALWLLASADAPMRLPAQVQSLHPALQLVEFRAPSDMATRAAAVAALLLAVWLSNAALDARANRAWKDSSSAVSPQWLDKAYANCSLPGSAGGQPQVRKEREQAVVGGVRAMLTVYGHEGGDGRKVGVDSFADAVAQLRRVAAELGRAVPPEAAEDVAVAQQALRQVNRDIGLEAQA